MPGGRRIVLTRQREANRPWAERLGAAGMSVLELPLLRYAAVPPPADADPAAWDWILFTSPQGVRAFTAAGLEPGAARFAGLGAGTEAALAEVGLEDALSLRTRDGAEFAAAFAAAVPAPARLLLVGPRKRRGEAREGLEAAGFTVGELTIYETRTVPASELPAVRFGADDIVFFCSPSAVRAFVGAWDDRPGCVAIGETTAAATREAGFATTVAATPDLEAMVEAAGLGPIPSPTKSES